MADKSGGILGPIKRAWDFLWHGKSVWSYIAFVIVSFLLLKYVLYPGFLFILGWEDIVAVLSGSMYHGSSIDSTYYSWLDSQGYTGYENWIFPNGLNIGDVVIVTRAPPEDINLGDVIVFVARDGSPIIHRVVNVTVVNGDYRYRTKGDANPESLSFELSIPYEFVVGKAIASAPLIGYPRVLMSYILGI
jgi:hypothetical protein